MPVNFTLFVDESGDEDLDNFRTEGRQYGSDPFLVFGGVLIANRDRSKIEGQLDGLCGEFKKPNLHCKDLKHLQKAHLARKVSEMRILAFGVISKKDTVGEYKKRIEGEDQAGQFYNKCASYLIERAASFMQEHKFKPNQLEIIFEKKRGHDYDKLRNLIASIRRNPIYEQSKCLEHIDPFTIFAKEKGDEPLLQLPDLVAHALYHSVTETKANYGTSEQRYLRELKPKFYANRKTKQIANHGIKYIQGPSKMGLSGENLKFALKMYRKEI